MGANDQTKEVSVHGTEPHDSRILRTDVGNSAENDDISFKELVLKFGDWFSYVLSKWVLIIVVAIIGGILGFTYASFKKTLYTATTTFVLESGEGSSAGLGQYAGIASMVGIDLGGGGGGIFQGENIIQLYKSRSMIEKTLLTEVTINGNRQLLIDRYIAFNKLRKDWNEKPELANIQFEHSSKGFERLQDSVIGQIVKNINERYLTVSKPDKKLSIIEVKVTAVDEVFAGVFNEQIVKNVNDFYVETKTKKALQNVVILQQKTDSVRAVMNGAIFSSAAVSDATPNLNPTRQVQRAAPMQRSQFNAETNKAILGELVKNLEMSKISLRKETPLIQVIDQPVYPLDKETFGKSKGMVLGAFMAGFLIVFILSIRLAFKNLMA